MHIFVRPLQFHADVHALDHLPHDLVEVHMASYRYKYHQQLLM